MKILYVIDHLGGGGAEQQFVHIVKNAGAEKSVYLTVTGGVRAADLGDTPVSSGYGRRMPLRAVIELKKLIESERPDIVHAFLMYSCFVTALALKLSRHKPVFIAQEFSPPEEILKVVRFASLKRMLLKFTYGAADKVVNVSEGVKERFVSGGYASEDKVRVIHDGLDIGALKALPERYALRTKLGLLGKCLYVSYVGALAEWKGAGHLIGAFREIVSPDMRLMIIGSGIHEEVFKDMARGDSRIEFLGYRKDAVEYIKTSDIFVLPSAFEGLPNTVIEAMVVGTPVIASDIPGVRMELIEDNVNGLLIPLRDKDALKKAISKLAGDKTQRERLAEESSRRAEHFRIERMVKDYEDLYAGYRES